MQLLRLGPIGYERPAVRGEDGILRTLSSITPDIDGAFLAADGIARVRAALDRDELEEWAGADALRVGAPVARPAAVLCIGQNYAAHAAETGDPPPEVPILFFKHPNTVVGPFDEVHIPRGSEHTDWEVELAVVIGRPALYLSSDEEALAAIAGLTISNDVSERHYQVKRSGGQWSKGKCMPGFNPLGPALVPLADVGDPQALRLWSRVGGDPRQDSTTADMIFSIAAIVRHLSHFVRLEPGDVVNTGTPQGVAMSGRFPYLRDGDVVEVGIDGLGTQRQRFVAGDPA
jgi:2,4-diketo-3-deoxy-L-fuconate hydrolase